MSTNRNLSPQMVRALCLIAGHGGLHRYRTGYGRSIEHAREVDHETVDALKSRGLVRGTHRKPGSRSLARVVLTDQGAAAILVGSQGE